jgi:hypothetical protein
MTIFYDLLDTFIAEEHEGISVDEWIDCMDDSRRNLRKQCARCTRQRSLNIHLHACHLICLATDSLLKYQLLKAATSSSVVVSVGIDFVRLDLVLETLERTVGFILSIQDVAECIRSIGTTIMEQERLVSDVSLEFTYVSPLTMPIVLSALQSFHRVRNLDIKLEEDNTIIEADIASFQAILMNHPYMERVSVDAITEEQFRMFATALPTIPNLKILHLSGYDQSISTREDAMALQRIVAIPTLVEVHLSHLHFGNEQAFNTSLRDMSPLLKRLSLNLLYLTFPETDLAAATIAVTTARSCFEELELRSIHYANSSFLGTLGRLMNSNDSDLKSLKFLGERTRSGGYFDSQSLIAFFKNARKLPLVELSLFVVDWSNQLEDALGEFVQGSTSLCRLQVEMPTNHNIVGGALAKAADSGVRCLRKFEMKVYLFSGTLISKVHYFRWVERIKHVAATNDQRHKLAPRFQSATGPREAAAVHAILLSLNLSILFEFLRRDEFGLQKILHRRQLAAADNGGGTAGSTRKRPLEAVG